MKTEKFKHKQINKEKFKMIKIIKKSLYEIDCIMSII